MPSSLFRSVCASERRQRGLGMLETMLLLLVVVGALVAGAIALKTRQASIAAEDEMVALTQADRFLASYVAAHNRLPCPATATSTGVEDCGGNVQKGLLPYRTLGLEGTMAAAGVGQLAYQVQRGAVDLAQETGKNNLFEPINFGGTTYNGHRAFGYSGTTADFCQALVNGAAVAIQPTHARVGATANGYPVAYALAHAGRQDADGDGRLFDGLNAATGASMELPDTGALLSSYDDRVVARTYGGLGKMLDCDRFTGSLDVLSLATEVVEEVKEKQESTLQTAAIVTTINGVKAIVVGVSIAVAAGDMGTATTYLGTASGLLSAAIASCVVLVGCFEIPHAAASVAAASVAITASAVAIGLNATALAATITAFGLSMAAAVQAGQAQNITIDISESVAQSKTAWDKATAARTQALADLGTAQSNVTTAEKARDTANTALYTEAHAVIDEANKKNSPKDKAPVTTSTTAYDSDLAGVKDKADAWLLAYQAYNKAVDALKQAKETAAGTNSTNTNGDSAQAAIQKQIDAETDPAKKAELQKALDAMKAQNSTGDNAAQIQRLSAQIDVLGADIAKLDVQIAKESDAAARAALQARRDQLQSQKDALGAQLASLSLDVASAQTTKDAAEKTFTDAGTLLNTTKQNAANKFNALPYVANECETTFTGIKIDCKDVDRTFDGSGRVLAKLNDLYDQSKGLYLVWWNKKEAAKDAQKRYDQSLTQEADAKARYDQLAALSTGGGVGSAQLNNVWMGAEDIVKQIDLRGAIR